MLIYGLLWYFFSFFSLLIFIFITALHFGEIDCALLTKKTKVFSFFYGLVIILFIITSHLEQTAEIISFLLPDFNQLATIKIVGKWVFNCVIISVLISSLGIYAYLNSKRKIEKVHHFFLLQTVTLLLIVYFLPFYVGFAFYFGLWHSLLSFEVILQELEIKNTWLGWKQLLAKAVPFSIIAWSGIAVIMIFGTQTFTIPNLISMLFVGIAILTLPHFQVFSKSLNNPSESE